MGNSPWKETYDSIALYFHTTSPTGTAPGSEYWWIINLFSVFLLIFLRLAFCIPRFPHISPPSLSLPRALSNRVCTVILVISLMTLNLSSLPSNCEEPSPTAILHNLFHRKSAIHIQFSVSEIKYFCHAITLPWKDAIGLKTVYLHFRCHRHT